MTFEWNGKTWKTKATNSQMSLQTAAGVKWDCKTGDVVIIATDGEVKCYRAGKVPVGLQTAMAA